MAKIRVVGNRLSVGSWSIPFARSASVTSRESRRLSRGFSAAPSPVVKQEESTESASTQLASQFVKPSTSRLIELAATITKETEKIDKWIKESGSPAPTFDVDGPLNFPKVDEEIKRAREEVMRATKELGDLVTGPTESIRWMAWDVCLAFLRVEK